MDWIFHASIFSLLIVHGYSQVNNIPAPKNIKITEDSVTDTGFWVTWEPVSKADSYRVILSPPKIGAVGVGNGITDKFTVIDGLAPDTEYKVTIIPVKGSDEGTPAVVVQRTALPAPTSLFVVSDSVTASEMVVGWAKVPDAQSYTLEVAPSTGISGAGRGIYKTSANLLGMTPNTQYTITVRAINWVGLGQAATIRQLTKLPPPSNVRVVMETVSHNSMSVHWDPVVGANTYEVSVSPPDGVLGAGQGITDTYVILRNLRADTQYRVQVGASNGAGLSEYRQAIAKTLSVCYAKAMDFPKDSFKITCPARCARNQEHVYGTREYTDDSYICAAAVHDGRIDDNVGGEVVVKKRPGLPHYVGTGRHGVLSQDYGGWHSSFVFGLQIPKNFKVQPGSIGHNTFTVEWDKVSGADAYRISVIPDFAVVGARPGIEDTKATLSNLKSDTEYKVYLTATNTLETSEAAILEQYTALSGPKNLQVVTNSVAHDRMNITWYPVPGASHYVIDIKAGATSFSDETKLLSSMIDGLQSGIRYTISVRPVNSVGPGETTSITQYTKLATPENVEAESVNWHRMHVQWDAVSGASHYLVSTVPAGLRNASESTENPWIWLEDLSPDTMYDIRIQAVNPHERSRSTTIRQMTALGQPRNVIVSDKTHNSLSLVWDKVKNADSYHVTIVSIDGKHGTEDERKSNKFILTGLEGRTEYKIKVVARNKIGDGKPASIGVTTLIPPPSNLVIRGSNVNPSQIEVTWSQMHDATGYYISVSPGGEIRGTGLVRDNKGVISGLKSGVLYKLDVMAVIGAERGMNASSNFATGLPSPTNVRLEKDYILPNSLFVVWNVVSIAEYYNLTYQNLRTSMTKTIYDIQNTSMLLPDLDPGTRYLITVFAVGSSNQDGGVKQLGSLGASTVGVTRLGIPMDITSQNITDTSVTVIWNPVRFATHYNVFIDPAVGVNGTGKTETNIAQITGLVKGEQYVIWVYAMNEDNNATSERIELAIVAGSQTPVDTEYGGGSWPIFTEAEEQPTPDEPNLKHPGNEKNEGDEPKKEKDGSGNTWIIIVVIVICLALLVLFAVVPCCCDCMKNKPLLKYHGWCGCCSPCSDVGCCGCRGCCNATAKNIDDEDGDMEIAGGRAYTPSMSRRTHSRNSYTVYH
ncbi:tenascin-N-like [Styela clava]